MKNGAPAGIRNGKAKVTFEHIQLLRKEWEERPTLKSISDREGVPINTLQTWFSYNSRIES